MLSVLGSPYLRKLPYVLASLQEAGSQLSIPDELPVAELTYLCDQTPRPRARNKPLRVWESQDGHRAGFCKFQLGDESVLRLLL